MSVNEFDYILYDQLSDIICPIEQLLVINVPVVTVDSDRRMGYRVDYDLLVS